VVTPNLCRCRLLLCSPYLCPGAGKFHDAHAKRAHHDSHKGRTHPAGHTVASRGKDRARSKSLGASGAPGATTTSRKANTETKEANAATRTTRQETATASSRNDHTTAEAGSTASSTCPSRRWYSCLRRERIKLFYVNK